MGKDSFSFSPPLTRWEQEDGREAEEEEEERRIHLLSAVVGR